VRKNPVQFAWEASLGETEEERRLRNEAMLAKAEKHLAQAKAADWKSGIKYFTDRVTRLREICSEK